MISPYGFDPVPDPIRLLSNDEFQRLTLDEKLVYLHELLRALLTMDEHTVPRVTSSPKGGKPPKA